MREKVISHDGFTQSYLMRRCVYSFRTIACAVCGATKITTNGYSLFEYGTMRDDDSGRKVTWHNGRFCGVACFRNGEGKNHAPL
jgi:hypothetical protein